MTAGWIRIGICGICMAIGLFFMIFAVVGVNRFDKALNRMHAAAMGDTMGILFVILGLIVLRGINMDSLKLVLIIAFFWIASPVSSHMLARLEAMTDEDLGELDVVHVEKSDEAASAVTDSSKLKRKKQTQRQSGKEQL